MSKPTNKSAAQTVLAYATAYMQNRGLVGVFPRLSVAWERDLLGWPVRNLDGGGPIAHFTTQEAAERAVVTARNMLAAR